MQYQEKAKLAGFEPEEFEELTRLRKNILKMHADKTAGDWWWARSEFPEATEKQRITFSDIEKKTEHDHWRPYFNHSHQEIHSGFVRPDKGLGVSESSQVVHLVGSSNSGMVEPGQNLAHSLVEITIAVLGVSPTLDTIAYMKALRIILGQVLPQLSIGRKRTED